MFLIIFRYFNLLFTFFLYRNVLLIFDKTIELFMILYNSLLNYLNFVIFFHKYNFNIQLYNFNIQLYKKYKAHIYLRIRGPALVKRHKPTHLFTHFRKIFQFFHSIFFSQLSSLFQAIVLLPFLLSSLLETEVENGHCRVSHKIERTSSFLCKSKISNPCLVSLFLVWSFVQESHFRSCAHVF